MVPSTRRGGQAMYQVQRSKRQETRAKERLDSFAALRLCEQKEERSEIPAAAGKREAR